jgi:hypothetical protein
LSEGGQAEEEVTLSLSNVLKPLFSAREKGKHAVMARERLYLLTDAGKAAWQHQDPRVPVEYRRLLGLIKTETHPDSLRTRLGRYSEADVIDLLDELVQRGLLRTVEAEASPDLDFTNSFNFADLLPTAAARR